MSGFQTIHGGRRDGLGWESSTCSEATGVKEIKLTLVQPVSIPIFAFIGCSHSISPELEIDLDTKY